METLDSFYVKKFNFLKGRPFFPSVLHFKVTKTLACLKNLKKFFVKSVHLFVAEVC